MMFSTKLGLLYHDKNTTVNLMRRITRHTCFPSPSSLFSQTGCVKNDASKNCHRKNRCEKYTTDPLCVATANTERKRPSLCSIPGVLDEEEMISLMCGHPFQRRVYFPYSAPPFAYGYSCGFVHPGITG